MADPTDMVTVSGLRHHYPGAAANAVDDLSFAVREREIFGLLGPNGAGKTTTIAVLTTLLRPTAGAVTIHGVDVLAHPGEARRHIGLAPQDIALYPPLTARENLAYFGRVSGLHGQRLTDRIAACLAMMGLADCADRPVATFSGGMKRRANLAAAMLHEPAVLFLDEPTVGIDAQSRNMILEHLAALPAHGATLVYTTHYMEEAMRLCARVAIVDHGRLMAVGAPAELIAAHAGCATLEDVFLQLTGRTLRDH